MRYRKPEELKETDVKWIGKIPNKWDFERLKSTIKFCKNGIWGNTPNGDKTDIPCIRVADFDRFLLEIPEQKFTIRSVTKGKKEGRILKKGDLILEKSGGGEKQPVGAVMLYDLDMDAVCSNFTARMPVKTGYNPSFLRYVHYHLYHSRVSTRSIKQTTGIQNLDSSHYLNEKVALPSLSEQRSIATFLDRKTEAIDGLIKKKEQLIERLKEKRQALITRAVTKGLNPSVPMKDSGIEWLEQMPRQWETTRLRFLADINTGSRNTEDTEEDGKYPFYVRSPIIRSIDEYSYDEEAVLTSGDGAGVCDIYHYVNDKYELHQRMYRITDFKEISGKYLYYYMIANFKKDVMKFSAKSTVDSLRMHMFKNFPIIYGSKEEQQNIVNYIQEQENRFGTIMKDLESQIEKLKEYRQSLISATVTGKIDVQKETLVKNENLKLEDIAGLVMYFIEESQRRQAFFGRLMAVKNYMLLHYILDINPKLADFRRLPNGPHDPEFWERIESLLVDKGWVTVKDSGRTDKRVKYIPNRSIEYKKTLKNKFVDDWTTIKKVVSEMAKNDSKHAEILSTVYAAWNDLMIFGKEPSEENILDEVLNRWPGGEKKKITESEWHQGIRRIKSLGIEPKGTGKPTTNQPELL